MGSEPSLSDFLDDGVESTDRDEGDRFAAVDPATRTYVYAPEGVPCEECGTVVERRWQQAEALVCDACKGW